MRRIRWRKEYWIYAIALFSMLYIFIHLSNASFDIIQCDNPNCLYYISRESETSTPDYQPVMSTHYDDDYEWEECYRDFIYYVIDNWEYKSAEWQDEMREIIKLNGIMYMDEATASYLGLWNGYEETTHEEIQSEPEDVFVPLDVKLSEELQEHVFDVGQEYDIPFTVLMALAFRESSYRVDILHENSNGSTDSGLMQINSCNWDWLQEDMGLDVVGNPRDNIEAAAYILSEYIAKGYTIEQALTAYNIGESGMLKNGVSSFAHRVLSLAQEYDVQIMEVLSK